MHLAYIIGGIITPFLHLFFPKDYLKKLKFYLFLAVLGLHCCVKAFSSCSAQVFHWGGFSCCGAQALRAWTSVVAVLRLSRSKACGIFLDQGSNLCPLHWQKERRRCSSVMSNSLRPHELYSPWNSPGQNTGVGSFSLLQGIFPTQVSWIGRQTLINWTSKEVPFLHPYYPWLS